MSKSVPPSAPADKGDNALWRIPTWFPTLDPQTQGRLHAYHSELLKFNNKLNLISRNTERDADETHFADCIMAGQVLSKVDLSKPIYDLGSGNGLPGIVFAILFPNSQWNLVESDLRKCEFLKHVTHLLKLSNCQIMNMRVESLKAGEMQIGISRGFANISKTLLALNKIMPSGGAFYHLKGSNWGTEIAEIPTQIISHWKPELLAEYALPVSQARRFLVSTRRN